ncbi:hypothetical protein G647_03792 [Cladophialophora carrionii CBS 160.54]|uniref:Uncharacterized protein n=1 Tax=Cladophialophora carrionii CBS 160.54 TaxID=1279043 RepID=V9DDN3_9EURO|nr:uncharacterized protein G647_03792 [Cladophialophora carrionii CBS 160.54]ETI24423.1 hypothetical protein G647_03792 [Cladophialophora carrionii CBS 160.54]
MKGVAVDLLTPAYNMLGTYGIFEKTNTYGGADFGNLIETGYGHQQSQDGLKEELKMLVAETAPA